MATTPSTPLDPAQIAQALQQQQTIINAAQLNAISSNQFVKAEINLNPQ